MAGEKKGYSKPNKAIKKRKKGYYKDIFHRPRKFDTVEDMEQEIIKYFEESATSGFPLTIQGLALTLGFSTRQSLLNYEGYTDKNKEPFLDTIKKAKLAIEQSKLDGAFLGTFNPAITIFDLKNNHGHEDKIKNDTNLSVPESITFEFENNSNGYTLPSDEKDIKE